MNAYFLYFYQGTIDIKNVLRVERDETNKYHHLVVLYPKTDGDRVFKLNAKNEKEQDEWFNALSSFLVSLSKSESLL